MEIRRHVEECGERGVYPVLTRRVIFHIGNTSKYSYKKDMVNIEMHVSNMEIYLSIFPTWKSLPTEKRQVPVRKSSAELLSAECQEQPNTLNPILLGDSQPLDIVPSQRYIYIYIDSYMA